MFPRLVLTAAFEFEGEGAHKFNIPDRRTVCGLELLISGLDWALVCLFVAYSSIWWSNTEPHT